MLDASQRSGSTSTEFRFSARTEGNATAPVSFVWDLGDGRTEVGASVSARYSEPGTYVVRLDAVDLDDTTLVRAQAEELVTVFDAADPKGLLGEEVPLIRGDIDLDGALDLDDVLRIQQHLGGVRTLGNGLASPDSPFTEFDLGDLDYDGDVDEFDGEVAARAELSGELPSLVDPPSGMPGRIVTLVSPALNELEKGVTLRFGATPAIEPPRALLGVASVMVPLDVLTPGQFTDEGGLVDIEVLHDGVVVDTLLFEVEEMGALPAGGIMALAETIEMGVGLRADLVQALRDLETSPDLAEFGLESQNVSAVVAVLEDAGADLAALERDLCTLLEEQLTAEHQEFVLRFSVANGLSDSLAAIAEFPEPTATKPLGGDAIAALCAVADAKAQLEVISTATSVACTGVAALAALAFVAVATPVPFDDILIVAGLLEASANCAAFLATQEVVALFLGLIPDLGSELRLRAEGSTELGPGESVSVVPEVQVSNLDDLCRLDAKGQAGEGLEELIAEPITKKVLKKAPLSFVYLGLKKISKDLAEKFEEAVEDAVELVLDQTVGGFIEEAIAKVCDVLTGFAGPFLPVEPGLVSLSTTPASPALDITTGTEAFVLTCPPGADLSQPVTYDVEGTLDLCSEPAKGTLKVECAEFVEVTISMGDNGTALDDIFQVSVDGNVVLTSQVPVTFASTIVELVAGDHAFAMTGLAAPDGIGTYFVSVTNAQLLDGPPLVGTNLTAGTTFTWTLRTEGARP